MIIDTRSGLGGLDHEVHHSLMDLSYLTPLPNLKIIFPSKVESLKETIINSYDNLTGPTLILYAYGTISDLSLSNDEISLNKEMTYNKNCNIAINTLGNTEKLGYELQKVLWYENNIPSIVYNITNISPFDYLQMKKICDKYEYIISIEENMLRGGFGSIIAEFISDSSLKNKLHRVGFDNTFVEKGLRSYIYPKYGLDVKTIVNSINSKWDFEKLKNK